MDNNIEKASPTADTSPEIEALKAGREKLMMLEKILPTLPENDPRYAETKDRIKEQAIKLAGDYAKFELGKLANQVQSEQGNAFEIQNPYPRMEVA